MFILKKKKDGSNIKVKRLSTNKKDFITRDIHAKYRSSSTHFSKVISKNQVLKSMSNSKVPREGLVSYDFYVNYQSTHCSKV